jgi:hypothetical protein
MSEWILRISGFQLRYGSGMALAGLSRVQQKVGEHHAQRYIVLATLILVSSLNAGCGCLAADSYSKPACQKYDTDWPPPDYTFEEG